MGSHEDFAAQRNAEINSLTPLERTTLEHRGPRQTRRVIKVFTKHASNSGGFDLTASATTWENEARQWARDRADRFGIPVFELPPTVKARDLIPRLPDEGVFIVWEVYEDSHGPQIFDNFGRNFDDQRIAAIAAKGPPNWQDHV